jgi:serine O-acetyltransferase
MIGRLAYLALKVLGVELPRSVKVGRNLYLVHGGFGVVIHPMTVIEDDVRIYPGVTVGRGDVYRSASGSRFEGLVIRSGAILGAGAKILCSEGVLVVGRDSVIGANAVLTQSTGDGEI